MSYEIPRLVMAAVSSGSGKTTVVTGLAICFAESGYQGTVLQNRA